MNSLTSYIKFIGAEDDNLDLFEGMYPVPSGVSYNSFFINDIHPAVIDAIDNRRCDDWISSIDNAIAATGKNAPEYLIVQHVEPDHSGSIQIFTDRYPDARIVCTAKAADMLRNFFTDVDFDARFVIVSDGDTISLGETTLNFLTAPMVHWPEVMMTLDTTHRTLFSADAFGSFAMSRSNQAWDSEARRYYANIVGRFGTSVRNIMKKLSGLKFDIIAPLHGPVLKGNLSHYWHLYDKWSQYEPENKGVLIAYASIYGGTANAARRLAAMLNDRFDGEVVLFDLARHDVSYAVAEAFRLSHMILCSVTYDADLFPAMHNFLHHLERKNFANRTVGLVENGSWAPTAARLMSESINKMKNMTIVKPVVTLRSRMSQQDASSMEQLVDNIISTL